jgi:folate-binding protein YgfZ
MADRGGVVADYHGRRLVRHFGDPSTEYAAATDGVAVFDRSHRARLTISGRSPLQMLNGVLTGTIPKPPRSVDDVHEGVATYHTVLTPKGRMITDLWAWLPGDEVSPGVVLDVPVAGHAPLLEAFRKLLPPRFAKVDDVTATTASISLVGPDAADVAVRLALGLRVDAEGLRVADEGAWWRVGDAVTGLTVVRTKEVWPEAFSVYGPSDSVATLWLRVVEAGAVPAGLGVWSTLRVEAGRPAFGTDMDDGTIPVEAGIHTRAIDQTKGCYTGQEVIVRIRDRGHVNRNLRRLFLGEVPTPPTGTELFDATEPAKAVGHITSAVQSPREGGVVALAYVRRGVEKVTVAGREVAVPDTAASWPPISASAVSTSSLVGRMR